MFSKKQLVIISFILALLFHFAYYFNEYGPYISVLRGFRIYWLALGSSLIMIFLYFATYWRSDLKGSSSSIPYDLLIIWIFVCFFRSALDVKGLGQLRDLLFNTYLGLSLMPVFFFIVGVNFNYFFSVNRLLTIYLIIVSIISLPFINYSEIQLFLLYPIFYLILTIPLRQNQGKLLIIVVSIFLLAISLTNRSGILRILISYCIVAAYYALEYIRVNKKLLNFIVFCILMIPVVSLILALQGQSIFQMVLGSDTIDYSQLNPYADTRTFLYYEVFQDLSYNKAFTFGKGIDAGYSSIAFETYNRSMVEVGFLQILMKTGIVGLLLYASVIISAIFKSLSKSNNLFIKSLGLLLASYLLLIFIENVIAFNLLNIIIWIVVGMCHSPKLRGLSNEGIRNVFAGSPS